MWAASAGQGGAHVAIHDVELDPVDAGILEPLALRAHVGPVGLCACSQRYTLAQSGVQQRVAERLRTGSTDGMICTGRGSPYSMVAAELRAAMGLEPAGASTKPMDESEAYSMLMRRFVVGSVPSSRRSDRAHAGTGWGVSKHRTMRVPPAGFAT